MRAISLYAIALFTAVALSGPLLGMDFPEVGPFIPAAAQQIPKEPRVPEPMLFASGYAVTQQGVPFPSGSILTARIDDYVTRPTRVSGDDGFFGLVEIAPPDSRYAGKDIVFELDAPGIGKVDSVETFTYEPGKMRFGTRILFRRATPEPTPTPTPSPTPSPTPTPTPGPSPTPIPDPDPDILPPPMPMVFANGFVISNQGDPAPIGSVLRARIDDYVTESSVAVEDSGYFTFLKITPPDEKYVGGRLVFQLEVDGLGLLEQNSSMFYEPRETRFGATLFFDIPNQAVPRPLQGTGD